MKKMIAMILLVFSVLFLVACNTENTKDSVEDDSTFVEYGVAGLIEAIESNDGDESIRIHVIGDENNGAQYKNAWVTVNGDTVIYLNDQVSYDFLEVGHYVNVFFDGPAAESYPVQATAKQINIIPEEPSSMPDNDSTFGD